MLERLGKEQINEDWANERYVTKNYERARISGTMEGGENDGNGKNSTKFLMMENQENSKKVVAYMHGTVGAGWWGDINAKKTREKCSITLTLTKLNYIHSGGGDAFEGIAICNYLEVIRLQLLLMWMA
ncbi:hypothetical protein ACT7DH_27890 [Bacillus pacificus]